MAWTEKYVTTSGSSFNGGTSEADAWDLATAASSVSSGTRLNIKAGSYSNSFSSITFAVSGTSQNSIWLRGYKTTPGDLDSKFTGDLTDGTDIPLIVTNDYSSVTISGNFNLISGISFKSESTNYSALYDTGSNGWRKNCRFHNAYNGAHEAVDTSGSNKSYVNCSFSAAGTSSGSSTTGLVDCTNNYRFTNCLFQATQSDSFHGIYQSWGNGNLAVYGCIFKNLKDGVRLQQGGTGIVANNTFVDIAGDAIINRQASAASNYDSLTGFTVVSNYFDSVSGYCYSHDVISKDGALVANNCYRNSSTKFNLTGDMVEFDALADSSNEFTDSASGDYSLKSTSSGYNAGMGGYWSLGTSDFRDVGAVQHDDPASSGGGSIFHPLAQ